MAKKGNEPTLADAIMREWSQPFYRRLNQRQVLNDIALARKFVLDQSMSSFMADLAYASLPKYRHAKRDTEILEGMRTLARLPHKRTFIEYDMRARVARSSNEYGSGIHSWLSPRRGGWLLMQHPTMETAFMAMECVSDTCPGWSSATTSMTKGVVERSQILDQRLEPTPNLCQLAFCWTTDDSIPPWKPIELLGQDEVTQLLTGIPNYRTLHLVCVVSPWLKGTGDEKKIMQLTAQSTLLAELASDVRYLWSLLAAINDTPVTARHVEPTAGHIVGGSYKKFLSHSVITLKVPGEANLVKLAQRVTRASRRRAHMVRGHWRINWRDRAGPKLWIPEHERGDSTLGFVTHDYAVTHGGDDQST